jgi:exonuclease III
MEVLVYIYIYTREELKFTTVIVHKHAKEQDLEIDAVQINLSRSKLIIICIYRAPTGNFDYFLHKLDYILNSYYKDNMEFIICGDINVNYLENNSKKA